MSDPYFPSEEQIAELEATFGTGPYYITDNEGIVSIVTNIISIPNFARILTPELGLEQWNAQKAAHEATIAEIEAAAADRLVEEAAAAAAAEAATLAAQEDLADSLGITVNALRAALGLPPLP